MFLLARYNTQTTLTFPVIKRAAVDFAVSADWTPATGDTKISQNGGAVANTTNNPSAVTGTGAALWSLTLTASELSTPMAIIQIVDSATKAIEDQCIIVLTYGNASAAIPLDLSINQTGDSYGRLGAPAGASLSADVASNYSRMGAPAGASMSADIAATKALLPTALVGGKMDSHVNDIAAGAITAAAIATGAIDDDAVAADMDNYSAKVWVIKDSTNYDRYAVRWFKNLVPITAGITSPTIQVIKGSDGTDLIASTALTEIGTTHRFKRDEGTNKMTAGAIYFAVVSATIDGATRTFEQQVGRDAA